MPSSSAKQHRFMEAIAHNPGFAKKAGVPQSVGKHFSEADKAHKFKGGGNVEKESKAVAEAEMKALKRGHAPKAVMEHERKEHKAMGYKHGGKVETGRTGYGMKDTHGAGRKAPSMDKKALPKESTGLKGFGMKKGGDVKHHTKHMKRGGSSAPMARPRRAVNPAALAALATRHEHDDEAGPLGVGAHLRPHADRVRTGLWRRRVRGLEGRA